jgi:sporulation protein YlmC with PRC-barrel domain
MSKQLFLTAFCAGCFALGAQAQLHSGGTSTDGTSPDSGLNQSQDSSKPSTWDRIKDLAATGRTQHEVRASQLTSAEVKSSNGESIGTMSELILNPNSGKVDFAVISLSGSTGSTSSSTPSSGTTGTSSTTSGTGRSSTSYASSGGKQVVVPWSLLHAANIGNSSSTSGNYSTSANSSSMGQLSFTYSGDVSKLQTAPAFDPNTDITKPGWLQSVFSYFGVNPNSGTGGATSPGGTSSGSRTYPQGNPSNNP